MTNGSMAVVMSLMLVELVAVPPAAAQDRPSPALEFAAGALLFADNGVVPERFAGGAGRGYISPRISVGPEISVVSGQGHSHFIATGNVAIDLVSALEGRRRTLTPFVVAGAGVFRTSEESPYSSFSSTEGSFTAGAGIRARIGERAFVGGEARLGWEAHFRLSGFVGVDLRR